MFGVSLFTLYCQLHVVFKLIVAVLGNKNLLMGTIKCLISYNELFVLLLGAMTRASKRLVKL